MSIPRRAAWTVASAIVIAAFARPCGAQAVRLSPDARVKSIRYDFVGPHTLDAPDLSSAIATHAPGSFHGLHAAVAWIPFVPDPPRYPFDPATLQQDLVRLRHFYRRQGFLQAGIEYDVRVDDDRRDVAVTFTIREGPSLRLRSFTLAGPEGGAGLGLPDSLETWVQTIWKRIEANYTGERFYEEQLTLLQTRLLRVFADRGYPFASVQPRAAIDSLSHQVDLVCLVSVGARVRVSAIEVQGVRSVPEVIAARQVPLRPGDLVSRTGMEKGRANLQSVSLFRRADVTLPGTAAADTALPLKVTVTEGRPRFTTVEVGYVTDGAGLTGQARWTHPNFTGGARSIDVIGLVQTGWWITTDVPDKLARATLTLNQPYVGSPLISLGVGPAIELRDGNIDRSTSWSLLGTLVYRFNPLQSAALRYDYTSRTVQEFRIFGVPLDEVRDQGDLSLGTSSLLDSLTRPVRTSQLIFFTSIGGLDDISRPRHGFVVKPNLSVTFPAAWGNVQFARADVQGTVFTPFPGKANAFMLRGTLGGLWPFGQSIPDPGENPAVEWLRLEDQVLTAGGATDVRGYENRLLGPKFPAAEIEVADGDTVVRSDSYLALGGLRRFTATAELRLALPSISRDVFGHLFADMGRVWTTDSRFALGVAATDDQSAHYTAGGGLGYYTPVGAIRLDLGYKLNPSTYDLRRSQDVVNALLAGQPATAAPVDRWRRFGLHLALGLYF